MGVDKIGLVKIEIGRGQVDLYGTGCVHLSMLFILFSLGPCDDCLTLTHLLCLPHAQSRSISANKGSSRDSVPKYIMKNIVRSVVKNSSNQIKYGSVHMALSVGPIIIENVTPE